MVRRARVSPMISLVYESTRCWEIDCPVYLACGCAGRGRHEEPRRCLIERSRQQRKSYGSRDGEREGDADNDPPRSQQMHKVLNIQCPPSSLYPVRFVWRRRDLQNHTVRNCVTGPERQERSKRNQPSHARPLDCARRLIPSIGAPLQPERFRPATAESEREVRPGTSAR